MNGKQTMKQCCYAVLIMVLICPSVPAGSPADDDPGMADGYKKMKEGEEAYNRKMQQQAQKGGQQGGTVIDTIANAPDKVYGNDESGQVADSVAGAVLDKFGRKILGNVPVSDIAETAGSVAGGDYDEAIKTFFKGVYSTVIGIGATMTVSSTAPAWVPIVVGGGAAYVTKKAMDYILNPPAVEHKTKEITVGVVGEPGSANTTSQEQKPAPAVIEGPDGPMQDQDAPPAADGPDDPDFGPGTPISIEDLAGQEPTAGTPSGGATPSTSSSGENVLDGLVDNKQESNKSSTDSSFKLTSQHTKVNKASTAGDKTIADADQTVDHGGSDAQDISDESATATASADSKLGWSTQMSDALQTGLSAGGAAFGSSVGATIASHVGNKVFGDKDSEQNTGSETTEETEDDGTTTSSGTGSSDSSGETATGSATSSGVPTSKGSSKGSTSSSSSSGGTTKDTGSSGATTATTAVPTTQTQSAGTFTAKLVPSSSSYYIQVAGVSSNSLSATVTGTDGYATSFSGVGSITSSTIPAGASGVNDTVTAKDDSTGETATFNFTF